MRAWWKTRNVTETSEDVRTLALDVHAYAVFQKSYAFQSAVQESTIDQLNSSNSDGWEYNEIFLRLQRCLAVQVSQFNPRKTQILANEIFS